MPTILPQAPVLDLLELEFLRLGELFGSLDDAAWATPTPCPGWDVHANLAHIVGTESSLAGLSAPAVTEDVAARSHVKNDIGALNEQWVIGLADLAPTAILERFRAITTARLETLRAMDDGEWNAEGFTPAGRDTYGRFMRIRVFDCWMHEQDVRDAVGNPGHGAGPVVELVLDEMTAAMGFVVGKRAAAPIGSSVRFDLSGDSGRRIDVLVGERASVVPALVGDPTTTMRMPVGVFTRLGGGRVALGDVRGDISIEGDLDLGERLLANFAYMI